MEILHQPIEFNEKAHSYSYAGRKLYSVTTILDKVLDKPGLVYWAASMACMRTAELLKPDTAYSQDQITAALAEAAETFRLVKEAAATSGTLAHAWIEKHIRGEDAPLPADEPAAESCKAYMGWRQDHALEYVEVEWTVGDLASNIAGKIDLLGRADGRLRVVDFKTGKGIYIRHIAQVAKYHSMAKPLIKGEELARPLILHLPKTGGQCQVIELSENMLTLGEALFTACQGAYMMIGPLEKELKAVCNGK